MAESRSAAIAWLALTCIVAVGGLQIVSRATFNPPRQGKDADMYAGVIKRLQAGEPYYEVVGNALRRGHYPTWPVVNWRTPLHFSAVAWLGLERAGHVLTGLALLAIGLATVGCARISRLRAVLALLMVTGGLLPALLIRPGGVLMPEVWASVFLAASLAGYTCGAWISGAVAGVIAAFVRELAVPYGVVCGLMALRARRRRECAVWIVGGLCYTAHYALHAWQAAHAVQPDDIVNAHSWLQFLGLPFLLHTLHQYSWLLLMPPAWTALALAAAVPAIASPLTPAHVRASCSVYAVLFLCVGQPFDFYWGLFTAPLWGLSLTYSWPGFVYLTDTALRPAPRRGSTVVYPVRTRANT